MAVPDCSTVLDAGPGPAAEPRGSRGPPPRTRPRGDGGEVAARPRSAARPRPRRRRRAAAGDGGAVGPASVRLARRGGPGCGASSRWRSRPRSRPPTRRCTAGGRSTTPGSRSPTPAPWRPARARCCSRARRPSRASRTRRGSCCSPSGTGSGCSTTAPGSACPTTSPTPRPSRSSCSPWCSARSWQRRRRCRGYPAAVTAVAGCACALIPSFVIWSVSGLENALLAAAVAVQVAVLVRRRDRLADGPCPRSPAGCSPRSRRSPGPRARSTPRPTRSRCWSSAVRGGGSWARRRCRRWPSRCRSAPTCVAARDVRAVAPDDGDREVAGAADGRRVREGRRPHRVRGLAHRARGGGRGRRRARRGRGPRRRCHRRRPPPGPRRTTGAADSAGAARRRGRADVGSDHRLGSAGGQPRAGRHRRPASARPSPSPSSRWPWPSWRSACSSRTGWSSSASPPRSGRWARS